MNVVGAPHLRRNPILICDVLERSEAMDAVTLKKVGVLVEYGMVQIDQSLALTPLGVGVLSGGLQIFHNLVHRLVHTLYLDLAQTSIDSVYLMQ